MTIKIELTEDDLKKLVIEHVEDKINHTMDKSKMKILVKSKQNYKSEWEVASYKLEYEE